MAGGFFFDDAIAGTLVIDGQGGSVYDVGDLDFTGGTAIGSAGQDNHDALYVDGSQIFQNTAITLSGLDSGIYQYTEQPFYAAGGAGTMDFDAGTVIDQTDGSAVIGVVDESWDRGDGVIVNQGAIDADGSSFAIEASSFDNEGSIDVANGDALLIDAARVTENGVIGVEAGSSAVLETSDLIGSGTIMLAGGSFEFATGGMVGIGVDFTSPDGVLILDDPADFKGMISGFAVGDEIDLVGMADASVTYAGGFLAIGVGSAGWQIALAGDYSGDHFQLSADGNGGTLVRI